MKLNDGMDKLSNMERLKKESIERARHKLAILSETEKLKEKKKTEK